MKCLIPLKIPCFCWQVDQLMRKCWIYKHDERTTFHNLIQGFETIMSKM